MRVGIYLGRHSGHGSGMGIYARGIIESIFELFATSGYAETEVVFYGDSSILNQEFLATLSLSPVLYSTSEATFDFGVRRFLKVLPNGNKIQILFKFLPELLNRNLNFFWDQLFLPIIFRIDRLEVLHSLTNYGLIFTRVSQVVTVHDLFQAFPPERPDYCSNAEQIESTFRKRLIRSFYRLLFKLQFKVVKHVVTVSPHVVGSIKEHYDYDLAKVTPILSGIDKTLLEYLKFKNSPEEEGKRLVFRTKYLGLEPGYVFHIASLDPRKNTYGAIMAWKELSEEEKKKGLLIQASGSTKKYVNKILAEEKDSEFIQYVPWVEREQLLDIFAAAGVVLFPSLAEGFGLPALEALTLGVRVVAPQLEALQKVETKKLLVCNSYKLESISSSLKEACTALPKNKRENPLEINHSLLAKPLYSMLDASKLLFPLYRQVILQNKQIA